ncbi:Sodium/hydrogen exchanger family-domain-containing protein [Lipomyces kononenkoae]|uniref:Sodium/hydrogen exchanger family-domain-containing protein n=1 Tax=Lipomyces kononenkoae TaxID=34357 RepID=A0ACC3T5G4_LIPKO
MTGSQASLAYQEPSVTTILNLAGFLLVLNIVNVVLDKLLYCGLIGQLVLGMLWGAPGANWLDQEMQQAIQKLGYLGLIMLVYEGGLSTSLASLKANLSLSVSVALTGIGAPIGLSFVLSKLVRATAIQAFGAGAALGATSLGTTFTVLSTTELIKTRLGVVITSAAMLDDVVGLVMVEVVQNLGSSSNSSTPIAVVRPVFVSIGFAVGFVLVCKFILRPLINRALSNTHVFPKFTKSFNFAFLAHTCILVAMVAGATYAGTSSLFAAYLTGALISWFDELSCAATSHETELPMPEGRGNPAETSPSIIDMQAVSAERQGQPGSKLQPKQTRFIITSGSSSSHNKMLEKPQKQADSSIVCEAPTGVLVFEYYYKEPVVRILIPLFFASIGFAIPITEMWHGEVIWRGIVYAVLMTMGKVITGLWLVRVSLTPISSFVKNIASVLSSFFTCTAPRKHSSKQNQKPPAEKTKRLQNQVVEDSADQVACDESPNGQNREGVTLPQRDRTTAKAIPPTSSLPPKPKSLYPSSILGLAMVARGEVGYLIASLGERSGIFSKGSSGGNSEIYLIVIWAITLCTLIGPISVGTLVRRVKKLQHQREDTGAPDPLGVWGI